MVLNEILNYNLRYNLKWSGYIDEIGLLPFFDSFLPDEWYYWMS